MRILSGVQPTGNLHIGNYLGMIQPMIRYQEKGELFCFLADLHSLTSVFDPKELRNLVRTMLADLVALGINPDRSFLWVQSDVPAVCELTWYLSCVTPKGLMERSHSYKDKVAKNIPASHGLFSYPVLMAADILLYDSTIVPVGKDQKQHLEIARDIAIRFNALYGEVFVIPEPDIKEEVALVPGTDGQKMSKSYKNTVDIFAPEKELKKTIMGIVTDSTPVEAPKNPDESNLFSLYRLFASNEESLEMARRFREGGYGYGEAKKALLGVILDHFRPQRQLREKLITDTGYLESIRKMGAKKANEEAEKTIARVRRCVGVR